MIFVPKCENFTVKRDLLGWQLRRSKEIVELKANCDVLSSASKVIKGLVCARVVSIRTVTDCTRDHLFCSPLCRQPRNEAALGFCSWLKDSQLKKCKEKPLLGLTARDGVELGLKECRKQFTDRRWNCSGVTIADVFRRERMLKTGKLRIYFLSFHIQQCSVSSLLPFHVLPTLLLSYISWTVLIFHRYFDNQGKRCAGLVTLIRFRVSSDVVDRAFVAVCIPTGKHMCPHEEHMRKYFVSEIRLIPTSEDLGRPRPSSNLPVWNEFNAGKCCVAFAEFKQALRLLTA